MSMEEPLLKGNGGTCSMGNAAISGIAGVTGAFPDQSIDCIQEFCTLKLTPGASDMERDRISGSIFDKNVMSAPAAVKLMADAKDSLTQYYAMSNNYYTCSAKDLAKTHELNACSLAKNQLAGYSNMMANSMGSTNQSLAECKTSLDSCSRSKAFTPAPIQTPVQPPPPPPVPIRETTNARCGKENGNQRCKPGECCSIYGWCGSSSDHCIKFRSGNPDYHGAPVAPDVCADISGHYNFCYFTNNPNVSVGTGSITINTKTGVGSINGNVSLQALSFNTFKNGWPGPDSVGTFYATGSKTGKKKIAWGRGSVWEQR
jgi:hypothetical protein